MEQYYKMGPESSECNKETRILNAEIRDNNDRLKVIVIFAFKRSTVICKTITIHVIRKHNSYTLIES